MHPLRTARRAALAAATLLLVVSAGSALAAQGLPAARPTAMAVTSPVTGDGWQAGGTYTITWTGGQPNWTVLIYLADMNCYCYAGTITPGTPNTGSFVWTIPANTPAGPYEVYIQEVSAADWTYSDTFTIHEAPTPVAPSSWGRVKALYRR